MTKDDLKFLARDLMEPEVVAALIIFVVVVALGVVSQYVKYFSNGTP